NRLVVDLGEEGERNGRLAYARKLAFSLFGGLLNAEERAGGLSQVNIMFLIKLINNQLNERAVEIVATKLAVAIGDDHLEGAILNIEDRYVECSTTKVINCR